MGLLCRALPAHSQIGFVSLSRRWWQTQPQAPLPRKHAAASAMRSADTPFRTPQPTATAHFRTSRVDLSKSSEFQRAFLLQLGSNACFPTSAAPRQRVMKNKRPAPADLFAVQVCGSKRKVIRALCKCAFPSLPVTVRSTFLSVRTVCAVTIVFQAASAGLLDASSSQSLGVGVCVLRSLAAAC